MKKRLDHSHIIDRKIPNKKYLINNNNNKLFADIVLVILNELIGYYNLKDFICRRKPTIPYRYLNG